MLPCSETMTFLGCLLCFYPVAMAGNSCVGKCGSWAENCWCNEGCVSHGDCCPDYGEVCGRGCGKCGSYTCDEWIKWDPKRYSCASLQKDWGCDCSGCTSCKRPGPAPPVPLAKLVLLDSAIHPEARCLDGSMAGYYLRRGSSDRFIIYFEGGGWCYDADCDNPTAQGTLANCQERANGRLGSTKTLRSVMPESYLKGMLSADQVQNPVFHNWTLVYLPYCDGASWTGDSVVNGLHFKGQRILDAVVAELESAEGIRSASRVVISGGSAGASAVYFHADAISQRLRACHVERKLSDSQPLEGDCGTSPEVLALPDAGFFLDLKDRWGKRCWPDQMRSLFNVSKGYGGLHKACLARYPSEPWRCLFPEYFADLISTRTFILNSLYDSSELTYSLRLHCCPGGCEGKPSCNVKDAKLFQALRAEHIKAWLPLVSKPGNGVWAPACVDHTMAWSRWTDAAWAVPAGGETMAMAVQKWLDWESGPQNLVFEDKVAWPNNGPCSNSKSVKLDSKVDSISDFSGSSRLAAATVTVIVLCLPTLVFFTRKPRAQPA